ncbi:MAG: Asp/Glu racemase [Thalassobaculaceae bacterium]|nr:Asp/Glu racemase [Thalassobaculaceae bacterium]
MPLAFETDDGIGSRATLGLIVLKTDETIEHEFRTFVPDDGIVLYHSRVQSAADVTPETLAQMREDIPRATAMLPETAPFDVIGYGCTSGATVIGPDGVAAGVRQSFPGARVTEPLSAARAAFAALGIRRIALLSPYVESVSRALRQAFEASGTEIAAFASFDEGRESVVARMTPTSLLAAIEQTVADVAVDGVFMSCTNLRMAPVLAEAERRVGVPVLASNQVLAWHMLRLAGIADAVPEGGRLFAVSGLDLAA